MCSPGIFEQKCAPYESKCRATAWLTQKIRARTIYPLKLTTWPIVHCRCDTHAWWPVQDRTAAFALAAAQWIGHFPVTESLDDRQ